MNCPGMLDFKMSCSEIGGIKSISSLKPIYKESDIKVVDGEKVVKRAYGKFRRMPVRFEVIETIELTRMS